MSKAPKRRTCFVICTEQGFLEGASVLLCESIRKFAGRLGDAPIYSFAPRRGRAISSTTATAFARLRVHHVARVLNSEYDGYPFANKPFVLAYAETHLDHEQIMFIDSDTVMMSDPRSLLLRSGEDIALGADHTKNIGSSGTRDRADAYWRELYALCGVRRERWTTTVVDQRRVRAYWNSGIISMRRGCGLGSAWLRNFRRVMARGLRPDGGLYFVEQSVLSATVLGEGYRVRSLPVSYNYPLNHQIELIEQRRDLALHQGRIFHYSRLFERHLPAFRWLFDQPDTTQKRWLVSRLELLGITVESAIRT